MMNLLTTNQFKMVKGEAVGWETYILHLSPNILSGHNVCPAASPACIETCLNISSHGRAMKIQQARKRKTLLYFNDRAEFERLLAEDIREAIKITKRRNHKLAIRLNGTSDMPRLSIKFAKMFPSVQFYDYTKILEYAECDLPPNYHLTFSRSEFNENKVLPLVTQEKNVAVLFDQIPERWKGFEVIDGDKNDLRFLDKPGVIVGLKPKNKAKFDRTGFVIRLTNWKALDPPLPKVTRVTEEKLKSWVERNFKARECAADLGMSMTSFYLHLNKNAALKAVWDEYQLHKSVAASG